MKHFRARRVMKRDVPGTARLMGRGTGRSRMCLAVAQGSRGFRSEMRLSVEGRSHARIDSEKYPDAMAGLCIVHCARHSRWLDVDMK